MTDNDKSIKVLVAEDQEIVRTGLKMLLEREPGIKIIAEAANGESASRQALSCRPDIVLMDLGMPIMDGIDATKAIKAAAPGIKVIILTTHDSDADVFAAMAAGADGYCLKSATKEQLATAIKTIAEGALWMDSTIAGRVLKSLSEPSTPPSSARNESDSSLLSARELDVLRLLVDGMSNQQMAEHLIISVETVKTHMRHIMEKLQVSDRTQAAVKALKEKLVTL